MISNISINTAASSFEDNLKSEQITCNFYDPIYRVIKLVVPYLGIDCYKIAQLNKTYHSMMHTSNVAPFYRKYQIGKELFQKAYCLVMQSKEKSCLGTKQQLSLIGHAISSIKNAPNNLHQKISLIEGTEASAETSVFCLSKYMKISFDFSIAPIDTIVSAPALFQMTEEDLKTIYHVCKEHEQHPLRFYLLALAVLNHAKSNYNLFTEESIQGIQAILKTVLEESSKKYGSSNSMVLRMKQYEKLTSVKNSKNYVNAFIEMSRSKIQAQDKLEILHSQRNYIDKSLFDLDQDTFDHLQNEIDSAIKPFACLAEQEQQYAYKRMLLVALMDGIKIAKLNLQCQSSEKSKYLSFDHIENTIKQIIKAELAVEYKLSVLFRVIDQRVKFYIRFPMQWSYQIVQQVFDAITQLNVTGELNRVLSEVENKIEEMNILQVLDEEVIRLKLSEMKIKGSQEELSKDLVRLNGFLTRYRESKTLEKPLVEQTKITLDLISYYIPMCAPSERKQSLQNMTSRLTNLFACTLSIKVMQQESQAIHEFIEAQSSKSLATLKKAYERLKDSVLSAKKKEELLKQGQENNLLIFCLRQRYSLFHLHPAYTYADQVFLDVLQVLHPDSKSLGWMMEGGSKLFESLNPKI